MFSMFPAIRQRLRRAKEHIDRRTEAPRLRLRQNFVYRLTVRTLQEMSADDATHMAAGVAYYALFSLFPLLLGLTAVLSIFLKSDDTRTRLANFATDYLPGSEQLIMGNTGAIPQFSGVFSVIAILGLLWSGSAVFGAVTRAVNRAWDVHQDRPLLVSKPRQIAMALVVGVLFLISLSAATIVRTAGRLAETDLPGVAFLIDATGRILLQSGSFILTLLIFLLIYKFLPNTKTYWRYIWPGALVAAVLFEFVKNLFLYYLDTFTSFSDVYGSLAPVIVLLLWVYINSLTLILGAELSSEYGRLRRGLDRGVLMHPRGPRGPKQPD